MNIRLISLLLPLAVALFGIPVQAAVVGNTTVDSARCSIAAAGNIIGNNVTCNFGLTPEQLNEVTKAAVTGATEPLLERIVSISQTLGITKEAAKTLLKIIGEQREIPDDRLADALTKVAQDYKRLQSEAAALDLENPKAKELVARAQDEIKQGHFEQAHKFFREATQAQIEASREAATVAEKAQAARDTQLLGAAALTATEGALATTELKYSDARKLFEDAVELVPAGHPVEKANYTQAQAIVILSDANMRGDTQALEDSLPLWKRVFQLLPPDKYPTEWAIAQNNFGMTLEILSIRRASKERNNEAITAYKASLDRLTWDKNPLEWGIAKAGLATALSNRARLGEGNTADAEEAIAAAQAALEGSHRDEDPDRWALAEFNLGFALLISGGLKQSSSDLERSVDASSQAQEVLTKKYAPTMWAGAQNNIGSALLMEGKMTHSKEKLVAAVKTFKEAAEEMTRERAPTDWAATQTYIGHALISLGNIDVGPVHFQEAAAAFEKAIDELEREKVSASQLAIFQFNRGYALLLAGERESGIGTLNDAVAAFDVAMPTFEKEKADEMLAACKAARERAVALLSQQYP